MSDYEFNLENNENLDNNADFEFNPEISIYANEKSQIDQIEELKEIKRKQDIKFLKIAHTYGVLYYPRKRDRKTLYGRLLGCE